MILNILFWLAVYAAIGCVFYGVFFFISATEVELDSIASVLWPITLIVIFLFFAVQNGGKPFFALGRKVFNAIDNWENEREARKKTKEKA